MRNRATRHLKANLSQLAQKHADIAIDTLVNVAKKSESDSARVAAANALLDRGFGKPPQAVQHSGSVGTYDLSKVTDAELDALESILGRLADAGGDPSGEEAQSD